MNTAFLNNASSTIPVQFAANLSGLEVRLYDQGEPVQVHGLPLIFTNPLAFAVGLSDIAAWVKADANRTALFAFNKPDGEEEIWGELKVATDAIQEASSYRYFASCITV